MERPAIFDRREVDFFGFTSAEWRLALLMERSPDARYRLCISGAPPWTMTLAELVAAALDCARSELRMPIVLEALDDDGLVLWRAWHSTQASFEARVVELVQERPHPSRAPA